MSNQIVISSGAKVRELEGVLTGTSGIVSSVPLGAANGVATLDSGGKVPVSQLPSSVVTYLGTWNAATNTPTLANGTGDAGDMYICNVAGTVNFGAGPITFAVGDWVLYGSGTWQKSNGQNGTVTSVAASITGNAIGITGSPITTAGTLALAFAGTSGQYINGAGNLVTFPTIVTEAQRLVTEVYNETGATLSKGTVVYINGGHGNLPTVTKAIATSDATSAQTYGVVQTDITNMNNGYVVVVGSLMDLDTRDYPDGTQLYLSSTTAGAWTSTKQYAPAHLVYVGIVVRSHPTQGVVEVRIQNGFELDELHNVSAQTPSNNQGLFYNSSNSLWENKSIATALGYTPANDASVVHLTGNETIGGIKTFSLSSKNETGIQLKNDIGIVPVVSGYTNLNGLTGGLAITNSSGISNNLLVPATVGYSYTFPAITGTIALLEGSVTYSGTKTFSDATKNNGGILLQNGSSSSLAGYMNLGGLTNGVKFTSGGGISNTFTLPSATGYTFTFPNATGTVALTSDLTGGTVTSVALSAPTGFSVTGSPVTTSGTLALAFASGYSLPTTAKQSNWDDAYTWVAAFHTQTGNSGKFLTTDGSTLSWAANPLGTVTSVAALTIGTSGTDLSSTVANSTTTPVITLNVPTASATNRGALSSADWTTFNNKQSALTNPITGTGTRTTNYIPKFSGTNSISNSTIQDDGLGQITIGSNVTLGVYELLSGTSIAAYNDTTSGVSADRVLYYAAGLFSAAGVSNTKTNWKSFNSAFTMAAGGTLTNYYGYYADAPTVVSGTITNKYSFYGASGAGIGIIYDGLLIGTSTNAGYKLDVNGTGRFTNIVYALSYQALNSNTSGYSVTTYANTGASGKSYDIGVGGNTSAQANRFYIYDNTANALRFYIDTTGAATFSSSVTAGQSILISNTTNAYAYQNFGANSGYGWQIGKADNSAGIAPSNGFYIYDLTNSATRMVISQAGNVGIGTTSPSAKLVVQGTSTTDNLNSQIQVINDAGKVLVLGAWPSANTGGPPASNHAIITTGGTANEDILFAADGTGGNLRFFTNGFASTNERMRITSGGVVSCLSRVLVNGATDDTLNALQVNGSIIANSTIAAVVPSNVDMFVFNNTGATYTKSCVVASMTATGGTGSYFFYGQQSTSVAAIKIFSNGNIVNANNSYGSISDITTKKDIEPATSKLNDLLKINIVNYKFIDDKSETKQLGVIAQEVEKIFPSLIDIDGNTKLKSVKYSVFVPMLIKAVQEQQEQINELKQLLNK